MGSANEQTNERTNEEEEKKKIAGENREWASTLFPPKCSS